MKRQTIENQLKRHGYTLGKFNASDTDRIGGDITCRWYIAEDGRKKKKFETLQDVADFVEFNLEQ